MSVFASSARPGSNNKGGLVRVRVETLERVKEVLEHLSLYIGLAIYTALGAKVDTTLFERDYKRLVSGMVYVCSCSGPYFRSRGKLAIICCDKFTDQQKIPE